MIKTALVRIKQVLDPLFFYKNWGDSFVFVAYVLTIFLGYGFSQVLLQKDLFEQLRHFSAASGFLIVSQLFLVYSYKLHRGLWKYSSISDLLQIIKVAAISGAVNFPLLYWSSGDVSSSAQFIIINHMIFIMGFGGVRMLVRLYKNLEPLADGVKRVLIIGAGDAGDLVWRDLQLRGGQYVTMGFIDDDRQKWARKIHGIKVLGPCDELVKIVSMLSIDEVILAMPTAGPRRLHEVAQLCFAAKVPVKIMPTLYDMANADSHFEIRNLKLEDLLSREPIRMDLEPVHQTYAGKRVLITGAAGSIGEELVKQVAAMEPHTIYLLDQAESPLYFVFRDCETNFPTVCFVPLLCDIADKIALEQAFLESKPHVVLHAAAYKHVPLLEDNIYQALSVNVKATQHLAELAQRFDVDRFVFISTDKAVNPTNILGVSKRIAELLCQSFQKPTGTKFLVVRFGNVIGSQGSVIPLFKKQIERGGPVTVTHADIQRYFMMIPEAVQLVLMASIIGDGGEIFVLDMGEQVKILDLANNMIRLCGFEPDVDIKIQFSGLRPGEKLFEELYDSTETVHKTAQAKINMAIGERVNKERLLSQIDSCFNVTRDRADHKIVIGKLQEIVTTYQPDVAMRPLQKAI
jgi:FlaA1/EpsC-like NDP-sugar epimerase